LVVKNGSKTRAAMSGGMGGVMPSRPTEMATASSVPSRHCESRSADFAVEGLQFVAKTSQYPGYDRIDPA
jgi:hypothetical protein